MVCNKLGVSIGKFKWSNYYLIFKIGKNIFIPHKNKSNCYSIFDGELQYVSTIPQLIQYIVRCSETFHNPCLLRFTTTKVIHYLAFVSGYVINCMQLRSTVICKISRCMIEKFIYIDNTRVQLLNKGINPRYKNLILLLRDWSSWNCTVLISSTRWILHR